jgi:hypothetical protein
MRFRFYDQPNRDLEMADIKYSIAISAGYVSAVKKFCTKNFSNVFFAGKSVTEEVLRREQQRLTSLACL